MQIKIEKNVPLTSRGSGYRDTRESNNALTEAVMSMSAGDSFVLPVKDTKEYKRIYSRVWASFKAKGIDCSIRRISKTQMRVWRVK